MTLTSRKFSNRGQITGGICLITKGSYVPFHTSHSVQVRHSSSGPISNKEADVSSGVKPSNSEQNAHDDSQKGDKSPDTDDTSGGSGQEGKQAPEGSEVALKDESAVGAADKGFLAPSDDIVLEYARRALMRDGRDKLPDPVIWSEDTSYPPILARGKKNVYDYTDDIPKHVKPFWGEEWYQQREYFQSMRNRRKWQYRALQYGAAGLVVCFCLVIISVLRIWMQQPKDIQTMRSELLQNAYGKVLELAAGHGQNIGLYPFAVHEIVMCDSNSQQLQTLRYRVPNTAYPKYDIRKMSSEALENFHDEEFDCVIDMFGLCHFHDPVLALRQMQRVVKPTGMILLLEHGATRYPHVNAFLNFFEKRHLVNTHGCKWNQPVMDYLKEARLEIKELKNKHFGTTYYIIAYPENIEDLKKSLEKLDK